MTDPKEKQKVAVKERTPKKKTQGTFDNLRKLPHPIEEFLAPLSPSVPLSPSGGQTLGEIPVDKPAEFGSVPPQVSSPASEAALERPIAPERDFNRRANSLERDALPSGLFPGSSKKIYDALYLRTRGAVMPCRTVQATKKDIAAWSGILNRKTIDRHLLYLETCGLVTRQWELGSNEGYVYEVNMPDETSVPLSPSVPLRGSDPKRVRGTDQKRDRGGQSQTIENTDTYEFPKTINTREEIFDDETAFAGLAQVLNETTRDLTGKAANSAESERWRELGEVLMAELRIAAARTTVSSVPSFLAEHLRRRLWKLDRRQARAEGKELPDEKPQATASAEAKTCADCRGSGWWYPDGLERGVAKCTHRNLDAKPDAK